MTVTDNHLDKFNFVNIQYLTQAPDLESTNEAALPNLTQPTQIKPIRRLSNVSSTLAPTAHVHMQRKYFSKLYCVRNPVDIFTSDTTTICREIYEHCQYTYLISINCKVKENQETQFINIEWRYLLGIKRLNIDG